MGNVIGTTPNYYEVLGVSRTASSEEIYERYLELCQKNEMIRRMDPWLPIQWNILEESRAYSTLSDPVSREKYDKKIDFDIVVLDKEIDKTELAEVSLEYKKSIALYYDELLNRFHYFKKEMNETIWLIKTSSIFFVLDLILSFILTYFLYSYLQENKPYLFNSVKQWTFGIFSLIATINFYIFRYFWQLPRKKKLTLKN